MLVTASEDAGMATALHYVRKPNLAAFLASPPAHPIFPWLLKPADVAIEARLGDDVARVTFLYEAG